MSTPARHGLVYLDGEFYSDPEQARVPLVDRGYLLGDALFETLRAYRGVIFALDRHLARLRESATYLALSLPADLRPRILETLDRSGLDSAYVRVTISRGPGPGGLGSAGYTRPSFSVMVKPLHAYPASAYVDGVDTVVVAERRIPLACLGASIKAAHYLPSILARRTLERAGAIEGIQLTVEGHLACGTVSNLFLVRDGTLHTPGLETGCLPGVTRSLLLDLAAHVGLRTSEETLEVGALAEADEIFFSNTLMEILPVRSVDGRALGAVPGPHTAQLHAAYRALVERAVHRGNEP